MLPQLPAGALAPVRPTTLLPPDKVLLLPLPATLSRFPTQFPETQVLHSARSSKVLTSGIPPALYLPHTLHRKSLPRPRDDNASLQKTSEWDFRHISHSPCRICVAPYEYDQEPYKQFVRKMHQVTHIPNHQSLYVRYNLSPQSPNR